MTKRINLILNGKGGVGKSFFAVNFVQFLKDRNVEYSAYDCDNENSTLKRFHADVEFFNLEGRRALDPIFRSLEKSDLGVLDCGAASTTNPPAGLLPEGANEGPLSSEVPIFP
jgi:cellulose biosynthesis protein BcsQ